MFPCRKLLTFVRFRIKLCFVRFRTIQGGDSLNADTKKYAHYSALLDQCNKELDELYHRYALRHNLSDATLWILYAVYTEGNAVTQADICNTWFFSRQTINTALKGLEQQRIIELTSISGNRKSKQIAFTASGRIATQEILTPLLRAEHRVFAAFHDEENEMFLKLSQKRCALLREFLETE